MNNSSIRRLKAEFGGVAKYICISQARCFLFLLHAMAENVMSSESVLRPMVSVKARTKLAEILYIFFGIHMENVVQLADRIEQRAQLAAS
jgi:hypothetical protein